MKQTLYDGRSKEYWRARLDERRVTSFAGTVAFFQREGLPKARAIIAARKARPDLYNEFHGRLNQRAIQTL